MYIFDLVVYEDDRKKLLDNHSWLSEGINLFIAATIVYGTLCRERGTPTLHASHLAYGAGELHKANSKHFSGRKYLTAYQQHDPSFSYYEAVPDRNLARAVKNPGIAPQLFEGIDVGEVLRDKSGRKKVYLITGRPFSKKVQVTRRREWLEEHSTVERKGLAEQVQYAVNQDAFMKQVNRFKDQTIAAIESTEEDVTLRNRYITSVLHITTCPPVYFTSPNSPRAFVAGGGVQTLPSKYRRILFTGCLQVDFQTAQTAIVATAWGAEKMKAFLESGGDLWAELAKAYGLEELGALKGIFKVALYSIIFGMDSASVKRNFHEHAQLENSPLKADALFDHELIQDLLQARERRIAELYLEGYLEIDGEQMPVTPENYRKLLAYEAQYLETVLIGGLYEAAAQAPQQMKPLLHLHDGIIFSVPAKYSVNNVIKRLERAAGDITSLLDVPTVITAEVL